MPAYPSTSVETMPTGDELDHLWQRLAEATDELEQTFVQICDVVNGPEPVPVTFADVGVLVNFIEQARRLTVSAMAETLDNLERLTVDELAQIAHEGGERASVPRFDSHGQPHPFYSVKEGE